MYSRSTGILILSILFFSSCSKGKYVLNEQGQKYLSDYNEFIDSLTTYHPALYEFTSQDSFEKKVAQLRSQIDNKTTEKDFVWKLSEVIALVGCGHTSLGFFNQERDLLKPNEYFPLLTRLINGKLYVIDNLTNKAIVQIGDEITEINDQPIVNIINTAYSHIPTQAHIRTPKTKMFNGYNTSYIPYALNFPEVYTIKTAGNKTVTLKALKQTPPYAPLFSQTHPCQNDFCLTEVNKSTALLTLRNIAYHGDRTKTYTDFLDSSFEEIKGKGYQNLIIDVRGNLGGPGESSIYLLRHTLKEPFNYFAKDGSDFGRTELQQPFENNYDGNIIFMMNGEGYSTVGHLASIYKDKNRVTFIGETLGSNQFCSANQKQFELTNTGFRYMVARNIFFTDVKEKNRNASIEPDISIEQSIDDFLSDKDVVLEKAIALTEEQ